MCGHESRRNTSVCVHVVLCLQGMFQLQGCYVHFDIWRSSVCEKGEKDVAGRSTCMFREEMFQRGGCYVLILVLILSCAKTSERGEAQICMFGEMFSWGAVTS